MIAISVRTAMFESCSESHSRFPSVFRTLLTITLKKEGPMPIIIAHILEGRPKELKVALVRNLTDAVVKTLGADPEQVRVIISEMPKDQYGIGGKTAEELGR